jgi:hypothetical protein
VLLARASKTLADYFVSFVLQLELISIDSKIALDAVIFQGTAWSDSHLGDLGLP